jgi:branched-chain amino acid transport system ATP-binding protein
MLDVRGLVKSFGGVRAVDDFSFRADAGEIVGIIGPNGAGKTTAFNLVTGIYAPDAGSIRLEGAELAGREQHEITRAGIGRTFQNIRLFRGLSVVENVMTAADPYSEYSLLQLLTLRPAVRERERAVRETGREYLRLVGLERYEDEKPFNLPYGMQRKLEIARALAANPKVLLLDEPAAGLNPSEVQEFIALVGALRERFGFAVLVIEHRMEVIMTLCARIYVLNFGKLLACGTPAEIRENREVAEAYIGREDATCSA